MPLPSIPEYNSAIDNPKLVRPPILQKGHAIKKGMRTIKYSGGFCVVFPYETPTNKYAIRCWHAEVTDAKKRMQIISKALKQSNLPYFVGFEYYEDGIVTSQGLQPIVVMDWVEAHNLKEFIASHLNEPNTLYKVAENFKKMVSDLHLHHFAHGDLQHGNILVRPDLSLILVDYDSMYTPELDGMIDEIKGLVGYQHKARWKNQYVNEKADYFSELVIYLTICSLAKYPDLWKQLKMEDTETLLFTGEDLESKGTSLIFLQLKKDSTLSPLVEKLCEFLQKESIEDLEPLEDCLVSRTEKIAEKWKKGNGYIHQPSQIIIDSPTEIFEKWQTRKNNYKLDNREILKKEANNIASKFKKNE